MSISAAQMGETSEREMPEFSEDENLTFFFNIEQIYSEYPQLPSNYATFSQSFQVCRSMTQHIVKSALKEAEEQFISRNIPINTLQEIIQVCNTLIQLPLNDDGTENKACQMIEDQEPQITMDDRWRRNRVNIEQKDSQDQQQEGMEAVMQLPESSHTHSRQVGRGRASISMDKKPTQQFDPKMRPLEQDAEEDEYEDKLRNAKLYELKKKIEIEQKKKEDQLQSQIEKKEGAIQKYTFDYDGKILLARQIKMDKLIPTNQKVKIEYKDMPKTVSEQKVYKQKDVKDAANKVNNNNNNNNNNPMNNAETQNIPNKTVNERKDISKDVLGDKAIKPDKTAQFPYETFAMTNGVKLMYEQKVKEGQRHQISDSVEQLQYKLSGANFLPGDEIQSQIKEIRLTRTEYKLLTDAGNIMVQTQKQQFLPQETQKQIPLDSQLAESQNFSSTLLKKKPMNETKTVQFDTISRDKLKQNLSPPKPSEKIQFKNTRMIENLLVQSKPDTPASNKIQSDKAIPPIVAPEEKNPIDQFNQQLLQSKDWGKQSGGKTAFFPPVKQSKVMKEVKQYKGSLAQLYKLPRDRLVAQSLRTQTNFYNKESRGKLGKTASEGFLQTFYTTHSKFDEKLRQS